MPSGDVGRPGWHKPVLVLAILLVVGQVVAFVVLRGNKSDEKKTDDTNVVATVSLDAAIETAPPTTPPPTPTETPTPTEVPPSVDAAVEAPAPIDAAVEETERVTTPVKVPEKKKMTRAELLAQQKKEREEKKREDEERRRAEQQERDRKKLEQERAAAEQAKAAAELERQKLAAQRAESEAAAAKAAAEKAKLEAAAKAATTTPAVTPAPAGPDVLVFVLGPGTPSVSSDQIRNVFLGRTTVWPNGTTARPLNRPAGTTAAKKFYGGILKMNAGAFAEHWSEIQLGGGGIAPPTVSSGKVTVAKVAATSGGFGYVMESELPENTNGVRLVRLK